MGEMQNIVYDGWLPIVLGQSGASKHKLDLNRDVKYSDKVDASIVNAFSTAAFRYSSALENKTKQKNSTNYGNQLIL